MPTTQTQYYDKFHNPIILGEQIGIGGEGRVCKIKGNCKVVAKLYLDKALQKGDKSGKIKAMCALYNNELAKFSALPQKAIYDSNDKVVGFTMEYLNLDDFKEIHLLYGTKDRKKYFDYADWGFMVHCAKNLACAVETLHEKGIVIGDINESNILVDKNAMIKLIDCDSYQVEYNNKFYLCEVGKPEYTAPELQGKSFKGIHRTKNHDSFGLAIMIFQILMLAKHPYSGINAPPDRGEAIEKGYYCFDLNSLQPNPNSAQWYYSQLFSTLNYEVKELFERAFTTNSSRPTAKEWIIALDNLEISLHSCTINKNHRYYGDSCIWCKLEQRGFKPFNTSANSYSQYNSTTYQQTPYKPQTNYTKPKQPLKQQKHQPNQAKITYKQWARQQSINAKPKQPLKQQKNSQNQAQITYKQWAQSINAKNQQTKANTASAQNNNTANQQAKANTASAQNNNTANQQAKVNTASAQNYNTANQQAKVNTASAQNYNTTNTASSYKRPISKNNESKIWIIILGILFIIGLYGKHLEQENTVPVDNTVQQESIQPPEQVVEPQKVYTEAEKQADIKAYKEKFIARVKKHWQPQYKTFLIDNNGSILVKVDKNGDISFPEYETEIAFGNANTDNMKYTIQYGQPYDKLPESYDKDFLTFRIYFEGNEDLYWGRTQEAKGSYQVSLNPIKQTSQKTSTTQQKQTTNNSAPAQKTKTATTYTDPNIYLTAVNKMLEEEHYHKEYPMTCIATITPSIPSNVKITKFTQNCDIAFHLLSTMDIPQFKDNNGHIVPLIVNFSGNSAPVAKFQYQPPVQKVNSVSKSLNTKRKQNPAKNKSELKKEMDFFLE